MKHQDPKKDLEAMGLRAKKSWGQNFLRSEAVLSTIAKAACAESRRVLEIGAGLGHLTQALLAEGANVVAIERDRDLAAFLREKFLQNPAVEILEENALTFDYASFAQKKPRACSRAPDRAGRDGSEPARKAARRVDAGASSRSDNAADGPETPSPATERGSRTGPEPPAVAGNLPYHLTSPIVFRLLEVIERFSLVVIMVQREVGDRMLAAPGSKTYGALSALVGARAKVERLCHVSRNCFYPAPKVDSVVLTLRALPGVSAEAWSGAYRKTVNAAFSARRKTLKNALASAFPDCERALRAAGISPQRRAETLSVEDFWRLSEALGNRS